MSFTDILGNWAVAVLALVVLLVLIARRQRLVRQARRSPGRSSDKIVVEWNKGPGGQITVAPWMTVPEVIAVFDAITRDGKEARFVGGCVRDAILKRPVEDVDIATQEPPDRVMALLEAAGIKAIPTGLGHGTVTAVIGAHRIEITTLRRDVETDGRHAVVTFTEDWREDAARRDFSFNAMSADREGMVYDYFNGLEDLANRIIRFVGPARERIDEDVLRVLRYFRFIAVLGMRIESRIEFDAVTASAQLLAELPGERIRDEMMKILVGVNPEGLRLMREYGVLAHILPEAGTLERLRKLAWLETTAIRFDTVGPDPLRRLAALLETDAEGGRAVANRFRLSNAQSERLAGLAEPGWHPAPEMEENVVRGALYRLGAARACDLVLLEWAGLLAREPRRPQGEAAAWQNLLGIVDSWTPVALPIKGSDAIALGIEAGPRVSEVLAAIEEWWIEGGCRGAREACLERLKSELARIP